MPLLAATIGDAGQREEHQGQNTRSGHSCIYQLRHLSLRSIETILRRKVAISVYYAKCAVPGNLDQAVFHLQCFAREMEPERVFLVTLHRGLKSRKQVNTFGRRV